MEKRATSEKVSHEPVLGGDRKETDQDGVGRHQEGNVRVPKREISMGRNGVQHWTQTRPVHLRGSVQQHEGDSALGD